MKFKMKVVHESPGDHVGDLAQVIAREQKTTNGGIPPSYPIQNERLLFIGVETKGSSLNKALFDFCRDLDLDRVRNVVFFIVAPSGGKSADINELKSMIKEKGINVIDDDFVCTVNTGLFRKGKLSDKDLSSAVDWSNKVIDALQDAM